MSNQKSASSRKSLNIGMPAVLSGSEEENDRSYG